VPTYNRKNLLVRCLQSLLQQTYTVSTIYVIDNGGSDGTRDVLRSEGLLADPRIRYFRLAWNTGSSGAYHFGIRRAVADGADWVWIVDDDSEAQCTTLERLITASQAADPSTVAVCPAVVQPAGDLWPNTGYFRPHPRGLGIEGFTGLVPVDTIAYKKGPLRVDWAVTHGLLVRASAIWRVGASKREFFYGYTDIEFTLRLSRLGPIWLIPESVIVDVGARAGKPSPHRRRLRRILPIPASTTPIELYWRDVLAHRNHAWLMKHYAGESLVRYLFRLLVMMAIIGVSDDRPFLRVRMLAAFGLQARLGTFRRLTPEDWQKIIR
jgi:GT2 family glycosyltransferase